MLRYQRLAPAVLLIGGFALNPLPVYAEWRCDCTTIVDSCNATVTLQDNRVDVTADRQQCARVDYFIDGQPFVAVVVDGHGRQNWLSPNPDAKVLVQSCQVCRDNAAGETAQPRAAQTASSNDALQPLIKVTPVYPQAAQERGVDGHVEIQFVVNPAGSTENPSVVASEPKGLFDRAAIAAIRRWRYPADPDRTPQTLTERLDFKFSDYVWQLSGERGPQAAEATLQDSQAPRNECVREDTAYNYGDSVEVGLINACDEPLLVYACAEGTGAKQGRWACASSEQLQTLLLPSNDARVGAPATVGTPAGPQQFTYATSWAFSRTPNSQYWWIACRERDEQCRGIARQWSHSVDGQLASVDPRGRATIELARSY
jgi:TonB family protein